MNYRNFIRYMMFGALVAIGVLFSDMSNGQAPPPPPPPGAHGSGTNQNPLGAPVDGGLSVFLIFAVGYGGHEWIKNKNRK